MGMESLFEFLVVPNANHAVLTASVTDTIGIPGTAVLVDCASSSTPFLSSACTTCIPEVDMPFTDSHELVGVGLPSK